jgi:hypothetical protein
VRQLVEGLMGEDASNGVDRIGRWCGRRVRAEPCWRPARSCWRRRLCCDRMSSPWAFMLAGDRNRRAPAITCEPRASIPRRLCASSRCSVRFRWTRVTMRSRSRRRASGRSMLSLAVRRVGVVRAGLAVTTQRRRMGYLGRLTVAQPMKEPTVVSRSIDTSVSPPRQYSEQGPTTRIVLTAPGLGHHRLRSSDSNATERVLPCGVGLAFR